MSVTPRTLRRPLAMVWLPVVLLVVWWVGSAGSTSLYFPPFSEILSTVWSGMRDGNMASALGSSLLNFLVGLVIATVVGSTLGILIGENDRLRGALMPLLNFVRTIPPVAFVPIVILALGVGSISKILLIAFGCFWPILLNTITGIKDINPTVREVVRAYRTPHRLRLTRVMLPAALPQISAGLRNAVALGIIMMIVSEMYGSVTGIGHYILQSSQNFEVTKTWAGTLVIGVLGYILTLLSMGLERLCLGWYFQRPPGRFHLGRRAR